MSRLGNVWFGIVVCNMLVSIGCQTVPGSPLAHFASKPNEYESELSFARLSERHGQVDHALSVYNGILKKNPNNQTAHHRIAVIATREHKFDVAGPHFDKAFECGQANADLLADVGYFFYLQDRLEEAEIKLREALGTDPQNKRAHTNLGLVLGEQGRYDEALAEFRIVNDEAEARANLAYVYTLAGDLDKAEAEYHLALTLDGDLKKAATALLELDLRKGGASSQALARISPRKPTSLRPAGSQESGVQLASFTEMSQPLNGQSAFATSFEQSRDANFGSIPPTMTPQGNQLTPIAAPHSERAASVAAGPQQGVHADLPMPILPNVSIPNAFNSWSYGAQPLNAN